MPSEVSDEEVDNEYMGHGQDGFDPVNPKNDVENPAGNVEAGVDREIKKQPGAAENTYAPGDGPVIKFFPITPPIETWPFAHPHHPLGMLKRLARVLQPGEQGIRPIDTFRETPPIDLDQDVEKMNAKAGQHKEADPLVEDQRFLKTTEQVGQKETPLSSDIHPCQTGYRLENKGEHQNQVKQSLGRGEAFNPFHLVFFF